MVQKFEEGATVLVSLRCGTYKGIYFKQSHRANGIIVRGLTDQYFADTGRVRVEDPIVDVRSVTPYESEDDRRDRELLEYSATLRELDKVGRWLGFSERSLRDARGVGWRVANNSAEEHLYIAKNHLEYLVRYMAAHAAKKAGIK